MVCESCGEKPKDTAKDFTKAVIEIDNPETLVLFRKVVIPSSMGDETQVPAAVGKYSNVLLVYEANNHAYLYSSDGIPTLLTSEVAQELEEKIDAVADDVAELTEVVDGKQNKLTAGANITIANDTISATNTTYTAGNAITIENNTINADIYPADYFTAGGTVTGTGSSFTLNKTIPATLNNVRLLGDTKQDGEPTLDNPQDIHVVTGEQTVTVMGKNLYKVPANGTKNDITLVNNGDESFSVISSAAASATANFTLKYPKANIGQAGDSVVFTISTNKPLPTGCNAYLVARSDDAYLQDLADLVGNGTRTSATQTRTLEAGITKLEAIVRVTDGSTVNISDVTVQVEIGPAPTTWEPFHGQFYTVSLGSIELCKIGNYQDFIYKGIDGWYIHKEIEAYTFDGSESWNEQSNYSTTNRMLFGLNAYSIIGGGSISNRTGISNEFEFTPVQNSLDVTGFYINPASVYSKWIYVKIPRSLLPSEDNAGFETWLSNNNLVTYYNITPINTKITNATLISQLNVLGDARSYLDATSFSVIATDTNLPAILDVAAYQNSLDGLLNAIPDNQVQADWTQADANAKDYIKNKPTLATVATTGNYNDLNNKPTVDGSLSTTSSNAIANAPVSTALNRNVVTDLSVNANTSTTTVQLDGAKRNLYSGAETTKAIVMPVASTTQAGVMNASTYDAVTNNTNNLNAIMSGAVAITGIAASPSQADLTTAWQTETGLTTLINRASIYDVDNNKVWTYYTNDTTWHAASNTSQVTINTFTNSSEGTIKGSTNVGQIFAENDGTGSVNGWDALNATVAGKQDAISAGDGIAIANDTVSANFSDAGLRQTYYIDAVNGDDSTGDGSNATPWKTLGKALEKMNSYGSNLYIFLKSAGTYTWPASMTYVTGKHLSIFTPSGVSGAIIEIPAGVRTRIGNCYFAIGTNSNADSNIEVKSDTPGSLAYLEIQGSEAVLEHVNFSDVELYTRGSTIRLQHEKIWSINSQGSNIYINDVTVAGDYTTDKAPIYLAEGSDCEVGALTLEARTTALNRPVIAANSGTHVAINGTLTDNTTAGLSYTYGIGAWASIIQEHSTFAGAYDNVGGGVYISNGSLFIRDNTVLPYTAGSNVTISNGVISATDTTYTAGNAVTIENGAINADIYPADFFTNGVSETETGPSLTLEDTVSTTLKSVELYGDTEQDGTPTPDAPVDIDVVTGEQTVRILGKNLFEVADETKSSNGIDWVKSNGVCHGTGTLTDETWSNLINAYDVDLPSGTYTFSVASPLPSPLILEFVTFDNDGVRTNYQIAAGKTSQTREFPNGLKKIGVAVVHGTIGNTYDITISDIQVEHGSTATEYEPYEEQSYTIDLDTIELCKIGNYQDYIYKSGDNWYLHKAVDKVVLDGTTEGTWVPQNDNKLFFVDITSVLDPIDGQVLSPVISNYLPTELQADIYSGAVDYGICLTATAHRIRARNKDCADVTAFKAWLANNTPTVYYALEEPTDTVIGGILEQQLDALAGGRSYLDVTDFIVTASDTNLPALLKPEVYVKSLNSILELINSTVDNLVVALPNGMTTYPVGSAPIAFDAALDAFHQGRSIFFVEYAMAQVSIYTVSAIDVNDGIWSMKVERTGVNPSENAGYWIVRSSNTTQWKNVNFFPNISITMTDTDPGEGSVLAANNFVAVYGNSPLTFDYSTSEVDTGATWIDGSAIYKKTINFGTLPNNAMKDVAHDISNLGWIVKMEGISKRSTDGTFFPIPFSSKNGVGNCIEITVGATNIEISTGMDRTNMTDCYITLYYTKSA